MGFTGVSMGACIMRTTGCSLLNTSAAANRLVLLHETSISNEEHIYNSMYTNFVACSIWFGCIENKNTAHPLQCMSLGICIKGQLQKMYSYMHDSQDARHAHQQHTSLALCHLDSTLVYSQHASANVLKHAPWG